MKKKSLKQVVFELLDKGILNDQNIVNEYGDLPNFNTVETYKYKWLKKRQQ
jgi:hypothetical protein